MGTRSPFTHSLTRHCRTMYVRFGEHPMYACTLSERTKNERTSVLSHFPVAIDSLGRTENSLPLPLLGLSLLRNK